ncbi:MAG: energy transducer TonB [Gemmatimonadota bacterium]
MFEVLVASGGVHGHDHAWGTRAVSLVLHSALIAAAVGATRHQPPRIDDANRETPIFLPGPAPRAPDPAPALPGMPQPTIKLPVIVPPDIPDPDPVPAPVGTFPDWPASGDTSSVPGPGIPGAPGTMPMPAAPIDARIAEEPPVLLGHPTPRYPELLRQAGIEGRVLVEVVLDTLGRAEPATLRIASPAHPLFDAEASSAVLASRYRPARMGGRPVRVRILVPVTFELRR